MMGFNMRPDARMAEEELKDFEILGRPVRVERASRQAVSTDLPLLSSSAPSISNC